MKKILILITCAVLPVLTACKKGEEPVKASIEISVSEISTQNASVTVDTQGPSPSLVRMTNAVPKEEFLSMVDSMDNETKIIAYANKYGFAITVPYTNAITDLNPSADYVVAVLSYDTNMDPLAWNVIEFTTAETGSTVVGDASGAGSIRDNELEDEPAR